MLSLCQQVEHSLRLAAVWFAGALEWSAGPSRQHEVREREERKERWPVRGNENLLSIFFIQQTLLHLSSTSIQLHPKSLRRSSSHKAQQRDPAGQAAGST